MATIDEMIAVLQAARDGKVIQGSLDGKTWTLTPEPQWNFYHNQYRVKPEPVKVGLKVECVNGRFWYGTNSVPNLELEFTDGKLLGAKVL